MVDCYEIHIMNHGNNRTQDEKFKIFGLLLFLLSIIAIVITWIFTDTKNSELFTVAVTAIKDIAEIYFKNNRTQHDKFKLLGLLLFLLSIIAIVIIRIFTDTKNSELFTVAVTAIKDVADTYFKN